MNFKKILTLAITATLGVSVVATTAISSVNAYDEAYESSYSYVYDANSYAKMNYMEAGNFVQTRAQNKRSTKEHVKVSVDVYRSNGSRIDGASVNKLLSKRGDIAVKGCSNYRSVGGNNYKHMVVVYSDSEHTSKITSMTKTVG